MYLAVDDNCNSVIGRETLLVFRLSHLHPVAEVCQSFSGAKVLGDDGIGLCGPDEGLGMIVSMIDPVDDGSLQLGHVFEGASPDSLSGDFCEQPLDHVEPRTGRRGEVQRAAWIASE